jgi:cell division protein FtsB
MKTESTKSTRNLLIILGLAVFGLGYLAWSLYAQVAALQKDNDDLRPKLAKMEQRAKDDAAEVEKLRGQTPHYLPGVATTTNPAEAANAARKRNLNPDEMATLIKNPAMQSIISSQAGAVIQMEYKDLMDKLKLSPEERDYMQKLLVAKQMDKMNIGMQYLNPSLSPEDKAAIGQQFVQAQQADDANVHSFLNSDSDFADYQAYSQQEPERLQVGMMETSLANGSEALDPNTADALTNLMSTTRQSFPFTVDFNNESNFGNPALLTSANVNTFLDEQSQYQAQVADKAAQLLTPAQLDAFKQNQAAMLQMTKQKMNSILQMSGGANK